jgi:transcriptional regulator SbtR-like protein
MINATGDQLLVRAKQADAVRDDVALADVLRMAKAFALLAETAPEGPALAERLLVLSMDGLRPRGGRGSAPS